MARIHTYDNFANIADEVLAEIGEYDLIGKGLHPVAGFKPVYNALCSNYMRIFHKAMQLHNWRFASKLYYLEFVDNNVEEDGFVAKFSLPLEAGDYYNMWGLGLRDGIEFDEELVAKQLSDNTIIANYDPSDDENPNETLFAYLVQEAEIAVCPFYFTEVYKNLLKQFLGWILHDLNSIASLALKEYPIVLQNAIAQDTQRFGCDTKFTFDIKPVPRW